MNSLESTFLAEIRTDKANFANYLGHMNWPKSKPANQRRLIGRYTAAFAVNFTDWIGKTYPWVRHELAQHALKDNLRCEQTQDHIGLLMRLASACKATPTMQDHRDACEQVIAIRKNLTRTNTNAGLRGLAILAHLESMSEVFIQCLVQLHKSLE